MNGHKHGWLDSFAVGASTVCLVHCLALPLLIALLPALAGVLDTGEWLHRTLLGLAVPISSIALLIGHRRHGQVQPAAGGVIGLGLLAGGLFAGPPAAETAFTVTGSLLLASAHLVNWRLSTRLP